MKKSAEITEIKAAEVPATLNDLVAEIKEIAQGEQEPGPRHIRLMVKILIQHAQIKRLATEALLSLYSARRHFSSLEEAMERWRAYKDAIYRLGWADYCRAGQIKDDTAVGTFAMAIYEINQMLAELKDLTDEVVRIYIDISNSRNVERVKKEVG